MSRSVKRIWNGEKQREQYTRYERRASRRKTAERFMSELDFKRLHIDPLDIQHILRQSYWNLLERIRDGFY